MATFDHERIGGIVMQGLGILLIVIGVISSTVIGILSFVGPFQVGLGLPPAAFLFLGAGVVMLFVGKFIYREGRRLSLISGEELLKRDKRPPVLYLRSFVDDEVTGETAGHTSVPQLERFANVLPFGNLLFVKHQTATFSEEEVLSKTLAKFGPCIAVGIPNEKLPPLGMSRFYFSDEEWKTKVRDLISQARLIVMRAGRTQGFWLELKMVVENADPGKVVVLLPFEPADETVISPNVPSDYNRFRITAEKILPKELPVFFGRRVGGGTFAGALTFGPDWSPSVVSLDHFGKTVSDGLRNIFSTYPAMHKMATISKDRRENSAQVAVLRPPNRVIGKLKSILFGTGLTLLVLWVLRIVIVWGDGFFCWGAFAIFVAVIVVSVFLAKKRSKGYITEIDV